jgi:hypothetical protein
MKKISNNNTFANYIGKFIDVNIEGTIHKFLVSEIDAGSITTNAGILYPDSFSILRESPNQECDICDDPCANSVPIIELNFYGKGSNNYDDGHKKHLINDIAKGILNANLGLNPQNNGEQLLIAVPPLTEERRRDLVKRAKAEAENAKVGVRNHRKDALDMIKDLKKDGLSEDMEKDAEEEVQKITVSFIKKIEDLLELKEKDIMTV